jgi:hypothetical protein
MCFSTSRLKSELRCANLSAVLVLAIINLTASRDDAINLVNAQIRTINTALALNQDWQKETQLNLQIAM